MKPNLVKNNLIVTILVAMLVASVGFTIAVVEDYNYFEYTAINWLIGDSVFLTDYPDQFNELVPTSRGNVIVTQPFPIVVSLLGYFLKLSEFRTTQIGVGLATGIMYLVLRKLRQKRSRAMIGSILYLITTPLLFFLYNPGYWFTAQVWGVVGAELALLGWIMKKYFWAGLATGIAMLSRINLGVLIAGSFVVWLWSEKKWRALIYYSIPVFSFLSVVLYWNYYRFGSPLQLGYSLIPGVLDEPWYRLGIMHWTYIWENFWRFLTQFNVEGEGLGILWAQPYLLLLPWIVRRINWRLILMGGIQLLFVLAHGNWGGTQFDFRYLSDVLWVISPVMLSISSRQKRWQLLWGAYGISAIVHLLWIRTIV